MKKFAVTGNIACGKSVALKVIKNNGYPVIDCDDIVKTLYDNQNFKAELSKNFEELICNNKINIELLKDKLFNDFTFKRNYEEFLYPFVKNEIKVFFDKNKDKEISFTVVPLLFEAGFENLFDKIVFISADESIRKMRLIERKSLLSEVADKVIASQLKEEYKIPKSDYLIKNNGTQEEFESTIISFLKKIDG